MPNWCITTYYFHGDETELKILMNHIDEWTKESFVENSFDSDWLGNILHGAGLADRIDNPNPNLSLRCRGRIVERCGWRYEEEYCFELITETAWEPMAKMWYAVIEALGLKTVGFAFEAEESGCGLYWIYDPNNYGDFRRDEVYIDAYGDDGLSTIEGYYKEEEAIQVLNRFFKTNLESLDELCKLCSDYIGGHEDDVLSVHRFQIDNELQE